MVITLGSDSNNPSSNLGRTSLFMHRFALHALPQLFVLKHSFLSILERDVDSCAFVTCPGVDSRHTYVQQLVSELFKRHFYYNFYFTYSTHDTIIYLPLASPNPPPTNPAGVFGSSPRPWSKYSCVRYYVYVYHMLISGVW